MMLTNFISYRSIINLQMIQSFHCDLRFQEQSISQKSQAYFTIGHEQDLKGSYNLFDFGKMIKNLTTNIHQNSLTIPGIQQRKNNLSEEYQSYLHFLFIFDLTISDLQELFLYQDISQLGMSKAQAIQEAESQIQSTANYEFDLLIANLKKQGVDESEPIMKTIATLRNQTFETYVTKKAVLEQKLIRKLKILSILTYFYQCESYGLNKLSRLLSVNKDECINLLLQASINKLITIKINEQTNQILIINSKIRERQVGGQTAAVCHDKLLQIKQKNNKVQTNICNLINIVDPAKVEIEPKAGDYLSKMLQSFQARR